MGIVPTSIGIHSKIYTASSIAMDGYDLIIYFTEKRANKGDVRFNYKYKDTNWFFTNDRNKRIFSSKPNKYTPQFGGYCTYTMSKGYTYPPDMKVWHIDKKGKLYFFKDAESKRAALDNWEYVIENAKLHWK